MIEARIERNASPEQSEDFAGAAVAVDGGSTQLQDFAPDGFIGRKIEFLFTVVTEFSSSDITGLHSVGTDGRAPGAILDDEVIAE